MTLKYRPDIDGLRAVAVLAVICFHTDLPGFPGGFVGVDVFFVISGYLITSIILKEYRQKRFSVINFYERRIRRIFPALFPVIAFTVAGSAFLFDAKAFNDFGKSVTATTLFSSNMLFCRHSGYFDAPSLYKPLLHTWSLAVEEQFYILFPLFVGFIHKYQKERYRPWILAIVMLSFAASIWGMQHKPTRAFFLVQYRAWELLAGSAIALGIFPKPSSPLVENILAITGLGLILYSIGWYSPSTPFPGYAALPPVLGAALIIQGNQSGKTMVNRILSFRPLVFIGLISYSLYLWHWPIVVFAKYLMFRSMNGYDSAIIIAVSLGMATLSWKYIEQPFRGPGMLIFDRKKLFVLAASVMAIASATGKTIDKLNGMEWRMDMFHAGLGKSLADAQTNYWERFTKWDSSKRISDVDNLPMIGTGTNPDFILWGDSHAEVLAWAIEDRTRELDFCGLVVANHSIGLLLGLDPGTSFDSQGVLDYLTLHPRIQTVIIAGRWSSYPADTLKNALSRTVKQLNAMGKKAVLVSDVPQLAYPAPRFYMTRQRFPFLVNGIDIAPTIDDYRSRNQVITNILNDLSRSNNVELVHPETMLFDEKGKCRFVTGTTLLYHDDNHLSSAGARMVIPALDNVINDMKKQKKSAYSYHAKSGDDNIQARKIR
jgi:peptidoglycan/LPS O-acetylase OafA/YrhL